MKRVDLRNNSINGLDVEPLAGLFVANQSINSMNLSFNELGNKGASTLIDGLKKNNHLIRLDLNGNNVSDAIQEEIDGLLRQNGKNNTDSAYMSSRMNTGSQFNTQKFERAVYTQDQELVTAGRQSNPMADAERYLSDERTRGISAQERLSKQVDDLTMKDLRGAQLVKEVESK